MLWRAEEVAGVVARDGATDVSGELDVWVYRGQKRGWQIYRALPAGPQTTVLDLLKYISEERDPTLAYRAACRMGTCGGCGLMVNGWPRLACLTRVLELQGAPIKLAPLRGYPVIRDLVVDTSAFAARYRRVMPYVLGLGSEARAAGEEQRQSPGEAARLWPWVLCNHCGLCEAVCAAHQTNPAFLGPLALGQAYRYCLDSRDRATVERLLAIGNRGGVEGCLGDGLCAKVCPAGIEPLRAIKQMEAWLAALRPTRGVGEG